MFTWALESSSWLGELVGTAPQCATITTIITVLTASAPSMVLFLCCREEGIQVLKSSSQALLWCRVVMH